MTDTFTLPPREALEAIEDQLGRALVSGDTSALKLLGYGEISCVVRLAWAGQGFACKRLPVFESVARYEAYAALFQEYLDTLAARGVAVVPSHLMRLSRPEGEQRVWCIQPELPVECLLPRQLAQASEAAARAHFLTIVERIDGVVGAAAVASHATGPAIGIDGQAANWAWVSGTPVYLDVTTPLLRDAAGQDRLDAELFLASLPAILRYPVKKLLLRKIVEKYYSARGIVVDFLGNLIKERLQGLVSVLVSAVAARYTPPITESEIRAYYASDAALWRLLQWLRRLDRYWQRKVRRRTYPFLLPGPIDR